MGHIFVSKKQMTYEEMFGTDGRYEEVNRQVEEEIKRLNPLLESLLPVLHERLKEKYGPELEEWLSRCESSAVVLSSDIAPDEFVNRVIGNIQEQINETYYLDIDGWEGVGIGRSMSDVDKDSLRTILSQFVNSLSPSVALKDLVEGVRSSQITGESKDRVVFFVYGAMLEGGVREELYSLWIMETDSLDDYDYMFFLENGAHLNKSWRLCLDLLPPEVIPVLDMDCL